jgi:hypothetical protein
MNALTHLYTHMEIALAEPAEDLKRPRSNPSSRISVRRKQSAVIEPGRNCPTMLVGWDSCRLLKLSLRGYPAAVLRGLAALPISSGSHTLLPLRGSPSIHRLK